MEWHLSMAERNIMEDFPGNLFYIYDASLLGNLTNLEKTMKIAYITNAQTLIGCKGIMSLKFQSH